MKISIAQMTTSQSKAENLTKALHYMAKAEAAGADIVVFPETYMAYIPAASNTSYASIAEPLNGPFVSALAAEAKRLGLHVVCGVYESEPSDKSRAWNTIVMLDDTGKLIHSYRKTHLYDAFAYQESKSIIASDNPLRVTKTRFGTIGLQVCYELRFPEISRELVLQGAEVLIVPTAWVAGPMKEEHFLSLVKARALENTVFACAADQVGNIYAGRSVIYDPMGVTLASIGETEGLITAELDMARIKQTRDKLPCLNHRRPELYASLIRQGR